MNTKLRKAQFAHNMARSKFKRFGNKFWEENRRHRNLAVSIRKQSLTNYFATYCEKHDNDFGALSHRLCQTRNFKMEAVLSLRTMMK